MENVANSFNSHVFLKIIQIRFGSNYFHHNFDLNFQNFKLLKSCQIRKEEDIYNCETTLMGKRSTEKGLLRLGDIL